MRAEMRCDVQSRIEIVHITTRDLILADEHANLINQGVFCRCGILRLFGVPEDPCDLLRNARFASIIADGDGKDGAILWMEHITAIMSNSKLTNYIWRGPGNGNLKTR